MSNRGTITQRRAVLGAGLGLAPWLASAAKATDKQVVADVAILRLHGLTCGPATLGSKYATLAEAKVDYPFATSLNQTLDWAAVQWVLSNPNMINGTAISLPAGDIQINSPLVSGAKSVFMRGCGPQTTRLLWVGNGGGGNDLFQHGLTQQPLDASFTLIDMGLYTGAPGAGYAINIRQNMNSGLFMLDNVTFGSFDAAYSWGGFVLAQGTTRSTFRNVFAEGGEFDTPDHWPGLTQIGFQFNSPDNDNKSFVFYFDNCYIGAVHHGIFVNITGAPGNSGSIEGMTFHNCCGRSCTGAWMRIAVTQSANVWWPPYYIFDKCNLQSSAQLFQFDSVGELHVRDGLFYIEAPPTEPTSMGDYMSLGGVMQGYITNNTFVTMVGAALDHFIHFGTDSRNVVVRDNTFVVSTPPAALAGGIMNDYSAVNIRASGNRYVGWPPGTSWPDGVPMETDVTGSANGNQFEMATTDISATPPASSAGLSPGVERRKAARRRLPR